LDHACLAPQLRGLVMPLKTLGVIEIPNAAGSEFDHGIFDPNTLTNGVRLPFPDFIIPALRP
jgi:hypothetical protein